MSSGPNPTSTSSSAIIPEEEQLVTRGRAQDPFSYQPYLQQQDPSSWYPLFAGAYNEVPPSIDYGHATTPLNVLQDTGSLAAIPNFYHCPADPPLATYTASAGASLIGGTRNQNGWVLANRNTTRAHGALSPLFVELPTFNHGMPSQQVVPVLQGQASALGPASCLPTSTAYPGTHLFPSPSLDGATTSVTSPHQFVGPSRFRESIRPSPYSIRKHVRSRARFPPVPSPTSVEDMRSRLIFSGIKSHLISIICNHIFIHGVSYESINRPMTREEIQKFGYSEGGPIYLTLLVRQPKDAISQQIQGEPSDAAADQDELTTTHWHKTSWLYVCALCDRADPCSAPREAIRHVMRDHLGVGLKCSVTGCSTIAFSSSELSKHKKITHAI